MTDLVFGVRVKADGSGVVGMLNDTDTALKRVKETAADFASTAGQLAGETAKTGEAGKAAAAGLNETDASLQKVGGSAKTASEELAKVSEASQNAGEGGSKVEAFEAALAKLGNTARGTAGEAGQFGETARGTSEAMTDSGKAADTMAEQLKAGVEPLMDLGKGAGEAGEGMAASGKQGLALAGMLGGVLGLVIGELVSGALTALIDSLFVSEQAFQAAELGADALGQAQSVLGSIFDMTSGKIERQNALLIANARLTAINLRADAMAKRASAGETFSDMQNDGGGVKGGLRRFLGWSSGRGDAADAAQDEAVGKHIRAIEGAKSAEERSKAIERALQQTEFREATSRNTDVVRNLTGVSSKDWRQALIDTATAEQNDIVAGLIDKSLDGGSLAPELRRSGGGARKKTPRARGSGGKTDRLEEFGEDAADKIAGIAARFIDDDQPKIIGEASKAMAALDDLVDDIRRKKPLNMQELLADAETARTQIRAGLIAGIAEPFEKSETLADKARIAFRALDQVAADFSKQQPPGLEGFIQQIGEARQAIQDGLDRPYNEFIESQGQALEIQRLITGGHQDEADALRIIIGLEKNGTELSLERKDAILATVQALRAEERQFEVNREKQQKYLDTLGDMRSLVTDILSGDLEALEDAPKRLIASFKQLQGRVLEEKLFGDTFRKLEDQITGADVAQDAAERMADAVDKASASILRLGSAAERATAGVAGGGATAPGGAWDSIADAMAEGAGEGDIVVTGSRIPKDPVAFFDYTIEKLAKGVLGENAAKAIGKYTSKGLEGAAVGGMVAGVSKMLGVKGSNTGGQIGGAVGGFAASAVGLPPIVGEIVGGLLGSVVGGMLKSSKAGSATIGVSNGELGVSGTGGNNAQFRTAASAAANSIIDAVQSIASQLGGQVTGAPSVSVGIKDGAYRVDTSGRGNVKTKKGAIDFGEDQASAIAFAALDAIKDGVISGLSAAVQKALQSSTDINKALQEALKVQDLELLLSGADGALKKAFRDFELVAAERRRVAAKYGFDLVKLEEVNGKQRTEIFDRIIQSQIGQLQSLLDSMNFGDLFEGSAVDQRKALLVEIAKAETDAKAGVEGAGDKVAGLRRQLLSLSKDAFGTAGPEFATDRETTRSAAEEIITIENERIRAAQAAALDTNKKLDATNGLLNEGNDIAAETLNAIKRLEAAGAAVAAVGGRGSAGSIIVGRSVNVRPY
ncbi:MAG TPA: hypothetical protein VF605_11685 [Allosphingosinicella sp.]|jgi:hypothetical protein